MTRYLTFRAARAVLLSAVVATLAPPQAESKNYTLARSSALITDANPNKKILRAGRISIDQIEARLQAKALFAQALADVYQHKPVTSILMKIEEALERSGDVYRTAIEPAELRRVYQKNYAIEAVRWMEVARQNIETGRDGRAELSAALSNVLQAGGFEAVRNEMGAAAVGNFDHIEEVITQGLINEAKHAFAFAARLAELGQPNAMMLMQVEKIIRTLGGIEKMNAIDNHKDKGAPNFDTHDWIKAGGGVLRPNGTRPESLGELNI